MDIGISSFFKNLGIIGVLNGISVVIYLRVKVRTD